MDWFHRRLYETVAWCILHADLAKPASSLRTPELMPPGYRWPPRRYLAPWAPGYAEDEARGWSLSNRPPSQDHASVEQLVLRRSELLSALHDSRATDAALAGRILAYDPGLNLFDGNSELVSDGFFDVDNTPPWDTWLCLVQEPASSPDGRVVPWTAYLLSWVPQAFVDRVQESINGNPEECLLWASQLHTEFVQQQRSFIR